MAERKQSSLKFIYFISSSSKAEFESILARKFKSKKRTKSQPRRALWRPISAGERRARAHPAPWARKSKFKSIKRNESQPRQAPIRPVLAKRARKFKRPKRSSKAAIMARKFKAPKRSSRAERVEPYISRYSSQNIRHFKSTKSFWTPGQIGSKEIRIGMEIRNKMEFLNKMEFRIKLEIRNIRSQKGSKESRNRLEIWSKEIRNGMEI